MLVSHMKIVVTILCLIEAQKIEIVYHHMFHLMARKCCISFSLSWRTNPKGCIHWSSSRLIIPMTLSCARRSHLHPISTNIGKYLTIPKPHVVRCRTARFGTTYFIWDPMRSSFVHLKIASIFSSPPAAWSWCLMGTPTLGPEIDGSKGGIWA